MNRETDFRKLGEAIKELERSPDCPKAKQEMENWHKYCFDNYPVGEVLKFIATVCHNIEAKKENPQARRWRQSQYA